MMVGKRWGKPTHAVVVVDEMGRTPEGKTYAATVYAWPFAFSPVGPGPHWDEFWDRHDELHIDRTDYFFDPEKALSEGVHLAESYGLVIVKKGLLV